MSQDDLKQGVAVSAVDAERIGDATLMLVRVLLREDARVQAAYRQWQERSNRPADGVDVLAEIYRDLTQFKALSADLGLSYRWLPLYLFWEFQRANASEAAGEQLPIKTSVPANLAWAGGAKRSRRPKHGPKQQDPLERDVLWFYRSEIKRPRETLYSLGKEWRTLLHGIGDRSPLDPRRRKHSQDSTVENAIARVKTRLDCGD